MNLVSCPQCGAQILAASGVTQCPRCKQSVRVPGTENAAPPVEPPAFTFAPGTDPPTSYTASTPYNPPAAPALPAGRSEFSESAFRPMGGSSASVETNPYKSPMSSLELNYGTEEAPPRSGLLWILFSFEGRIPRRTFWAAEIGVRVAGYALMLPVAAVLEGQQAEDMMNMISLVMAIPMLWISLAIAVKRWHDLDKSGWWVLINFIPCIGPLWAIIETGFFRGTIGRNQYGPDPT